MKLYRIVKSYEVQVTYELEAESEEKAIDDTSPENAVNEDWEYKDLIESDVK